MPNVVDRSPRWVAWKVDVIANAQLNKMLGAIVHPSHLDQNYVPASASALRLPAVSAHGADTPSDGISFIEMDAPKKSSRRSSDSSGTKETWADKIRQTMGRRSSSNRELGGVSQDQSFFDMRHKVGGWRRHKASASTPAAVLLSEADRGFCDKAAEMSALEKDMVRKKAKKLSQVRNTLKPCVSRN